MEILGLEKVSMVDFEGKLCATVFTGGCNFCCPFCHNAGIVFKEFLPYDEEYVFEGVEKISEIINLGLPSVNNNWINNKQYWNERANGNDCVSLEITLDPSKVTEKFKVVLVYNHEWYESNELVFSNIYHPNYAESI